MTNSDSEKELLRIFFEKLTERTVDKLVLEVEEGNSAARKLYAAEGYRLVSSSPLSAFGVELTEETWVLDLEAAG